MAEISSGTYWREHTVYNTKCILFQYLFLKQFIFMVQDILCILLNTYADRKSILETLS